jgi:hypothetical protein
MDKLVKRLRSKGCTEIELEAADEIERLRAVLQRMLDGKGSLSAAACLDIAREALRGSGDK